MVGLVASRLKEKFSRPAFAIALEPGGIGTGSGRSISGVDIGKAVRQAVKEKLLMKGGGHAMAAGVTLRKEKLAEFRAFMESALAADVAASRHENELFIDGAVTARGVTTEFAATLNRAGPFGAGNPEPVIALPAHQLVYADEVGQAHLRLRFKPATAPSSTASRFVRSDRNLEMRWRKIAASRCMSRDRSPSTATRVRSGCRCVSSTLQCRIRGRR